MQRLSVKPTLRGWSNYVFGRKDDDTTYQVWNLELHIDRTYGYSLRKYSVTIGIFPYIASGINSTRIIYIFAYYVVYSLLATIFYLLICSGNLQGLTTRKSLCRLDGVATPLRNRENYLRLLFCMRPLLRTEKEGEYAILTTDRSKRRRIYGIMIFCILAIYALIHYIVIYRVLGWKGSAGVPDKYVLLCVVGTDVILNLLKLLVSGLMMHLPAHCWERAYLARPKKTIGEADDPSPSV